MANLTSYELIRNILEERLNSIIKKEPALYYMVFQYNDCNFSLILN